jgi:hypothetical protein
VTLPAALAPFGAYRQFIVYRAVPSVRPGKLDKQPLDWRTGNLADAHDPAVWVTYDEAAQAAHKLGGSHGIGFVFTDHDPFWFLDIDACLLPSHVWSPLANELCALLAGAAVEVSISGTGLHVFGVGRIPAHASTNKALGLELYHTKRFVALGTGAVGNAMTDCSEGLAQVIARYFERRASDAPAAEWTAAPDPLWRGPTDDDDLIRRACNSKSAGAVFGSRATFANLWDADEPALHVAYPDPTRPYDASSADAALAQHLAFWTGKDCARIERLMLRSRLKRAKWSEHASYMQRTVLQAVGQQRDVLQDKQVEPAATTGKARDVTGETWLTPEDMKIMFDGCVYVSSEHAIMMRDGQVYGEGRFNAMCGGFTYTLDRNAGKPAKSPWSAFLDSRDVRFPKVHEREFAPYRALGETWTEGNVSYVNSYVPIATPAKRGNPKPFLDHLARLLPETRDREIVLAYMAAIVQYPGVKFQWAPLIQGAEGNGKTLLSRCIIQAVGRQYCHVPKASQIASHFNDWIDGKIFIAVEDVFPSDNTDLIEALTPMLTNDWLEIEGKGRAKVSRHVCANFMFNANAKDAVRKTRDGRRFAMFYTAQQTKRDIERDGMGGDYFPNLYNWLKRDGYAIVTDYLKSYAIPDALNPATHCHRAPGTSSTDEAVIASANRVQQEIVEYIEMDRVGFRGGWVSSHYLDNLIREQRAEARWPRNKRSDLMGELGYTLHPGLPKGQAHNAISPDGMRSRLYIKDGHTDAALKGAAVAGAYTAAQTAPLAGTAAPHLRVAT